MNAIQQVLLRLTIVTLLSVCLSPSAVTAQDADPRQAVDVNLVRLEHARAAEVADALRQLLPLDNNERVTIDQRTNSLLIMAQPDRFRFIASLIEVIDQPLGDRSSADGGPVVRVFALEHASAASALGTMNTLFGGRDGDVRMALDERTNQIVVRGRAERIDAFGDVIAMLDQPVQTAGAPRELLVRVAWLVSDGKESPRLPKGLDAVAQELAAYGVGSLRLATQTMLRVTTGEEFSTEFLAELDRAWQMELNGMATAEPSGKRKLQIMLRGSEDVSPVEQQAGRNVGPVRQPRGRQVDLRTTITTRSGDFIVLGVTPIGQMESAFVVQVIDQ